MPIPVGFELEEAVAPEATEPTLTPKVPEGFELETERRPLLVPNLPNYLKFKLNADRASSERSRYGKEAMWGKMDTQEAIAKGNEARDYWMTQAGPYEDLSFKKHPFKYVAGESVQLLPYMISSQVEGLKYGLTLGGGFAAITAVAGQAGPQVMLPEEVITVPAAFAGGMATGYSYGVIKNILDREGGGLYLDMAEKGISPGTAQPLALAGGTMIGIIELMQFKLLGKPFKQAFSKVIRSKVGKAAITQAIGRYAKSVGIQVLQEDLQEITSLISETIGSTIDEKPDATPTKEEWMTRLYETTARSLAGLAVISAPGAAVDVTTTMRQQKIIKKVEDINLLNKIIAELKEQQVGQEKQVIEPLVEKEEIKPAPTGEGKVTVYYRTDVPIEQIKKEGFKSLENTKEIFVSNQKEGQAIGYGKNIIELKVSPKDLRLDDEFPSGEQHFAINKDIASKSISQPTEEGKVKITPEKVKPDISGISPLQKQIQAMEERQTRVEIAKDALQEIDTVREYFRRRITKYKDAYLKEELAGIPSIFITKEGGIKPDEAIDELRTQFNIEITDESELKEYLKNLEQSHKDLISAIETYRPGFITKKETTLLADKIKTVEMGIREGKIQAKAEVKQVQEEIIDLMESLRLETDDKAKFLRTMKNVQTKEQLQKALPEITERLYKIREQSERSELVADLRDLFERQPTKNLPIEYKDVIEDIKSKVLLKERKPEVKKRLESMRQFVERMAEQGEEINIPQEKLDLLDKASVDEMTTEQLRDLKETVTRLYHQGRLKNKLLTALQERKFDEIKAEIINTITQGRGLNEDSSIVKALREQNKSLKDKSLEHIKNYIIENMRPELMLNILDGGAPGLIIGTLFNPLWESQKAELQESQKVSDTIKDIHKNLNLAEIFVKKYDIGRFEGMIKDQALFIYANSFNDSNRAHLYGSGITDEDITAIENFLSAEEKQSVKDIIRFYDEYQYPILNKIYTELEGVHLSKEEQYFSIDRLEDISYQKELEKDILERNYIRRPGVSKGFTKERVTSKKGFSEFSYFGTILRNYRKVEHYKAFAESIRDANKILNNPEIRTAIKEKLGDKYHQVLDKWLKDVAYGGDRASMASIDKMCQWLRTNYATAVIGGNLLSVMKAPVSYVQGMEMAGKWNTIKASLKFVLAPLNWNEKIDEKSILMKFRPMRQERELNEIVAQRTLRQQVGRVTGYQAIREGSMLPWVIADKATCDIVWLAAYDDAKADMSEQQAIDYADMVIRRTQPMSGALNLPDTFRGPEYQKLFTLFRNQQNQNFNLLLESVLQKQKGKIGVGEFSSHLVFYLLVPAVMIGAISRKRLPEDWGEFAKDILSGALGGLIYVGNMLSILAMGFMGATTPLDSLYEDVYKTVQAKDNWKKLDHLASMISKVVGFPYLAIKRIVTGKPLGEPAKTKKKGLELI